MFVGIIALCWRGIKKIKDPQREMKVQKKKRDYKKIIFLTLGVFIAFLSAIKILSDGFSWSPLIIGFIGLSLIGYAFEEKEAQRNKKPKQEKSAKHKTLETPHQKIKNSYGVDPFKSKQDLKKFVFLAIEDGTLSGEDDVAISLALEKFNLDPTFVEMIFIDKFEEKTHHIIEKVSRTKQLTNDQWEYIQRIAKGLGVPDYDMDNEMKAYHDNWLALQNNPVDIFEGAEPEGFIRETKRKTEWRNVKETEVVMTYKDYEGNKTKRSVLIRRVSEYGAFEAFCLKRKAMRTFKIKSVVEMTDFKTGEILEDYKDVKAYFERLLK